MRRLACPGIILWLLLGPVQAGSERPPVPLYSPPLASPVAAAGTGLAPEVSVRVTIDERGKVAEVVVESIQPTSTLDAEFEQVVRDTLRRWRYAPATRDGRPVPVTLNWMVQFPTLAGRDDEPSTDREWRRFGADRIPADLHSRLLRLPEEQRVNYLEEHANVAAGFLDQEALTSSSSPRFSVYSDVPGDEVAGVVASNLEATFNILEEILGERLAPRTERYKVIVVLYASKSDYRRLTLRLSNLEWSEGFYSPVGMLAFHMQMPSNESLLGTMLHEGTHAYVDRYVARPGVVFPRWLNEGFAEYIGNSTIRKGELIPGKTRRLEVYRSLWGAVPGEASTRFGIREVRLAQRKGLAPTARELVATDAQEFYGERRELYYPMSWLLVHFLRHGEPTWAETRFPELMLYVAEGYPPPAALEAIYGDLDLLDERFRDYVKSL